MRLTLASYFFIIFSGTLEALPVPSHLSCAFLKAIVDNPIDEAPRLIYADFLDEQAFPDRALFIRMQIELNSLRGSKQKDIATRERIKFLDVEIKQILQKHRTEWLGGVRASQDVVFKRGFIDIARLGFKKFFELDAIDTDVTAAIDSLRLSASSRDPVLTEDLIIKVATSKLVRQLRSLDIYFGQTVLPTNTQIVFFKNLDSPHLTYLRLPVSSDSSLYGIQEWKGLEKLESLRIHQYYVSTIAIRSLFSNERISGLKLFTAEFGSLNDASVALIAESQNLRNLKFLGISDNYNLTVQSLNSLAASRTLTALKSLRISSDLANQDGATEALRILRDEKGIVVEITEPMDETLRWMRNP